MINTKLRLGFLGAFLIPTILSASTIVSGLPDTTDAPFPFAIKASYFNVQSRSLFVGANEIPPTQYKDRAVAYAGPTDLYFKGMTPEKVTLNGIAGSTNPLYGAPILYISMLDRYPLVVPQTQPNMVYLVRNYFSPDMIQMYSAGPLKDANNNVSQGIAAFASIPENDSNSIFSAIVLPSAGVLGDPGTAYLVGGIENGVFQIGVTSPLDRTTAALKIGSDLANILNVSMHYSEKLANNSPRGFFYTGFVATGGSNPTDGVRGVTIDGNIEIAPITAFAANSIVGGVGPNTQVSINHISTLHTSTRLHYLVVCGGIGTPTTTATSVYALPLINNDPSFRKLAAKTAVPTNRYFIGQGVPSLIGRSLDTPAQNVGDLFSPTDDDIYRAQVGGTATLPGAVSRLWTVKDTVYVAVDNNPGGIFASQALFEKNGLVNGWTNWQPVNGIMQQTPYGAVDRNNGIDWFEGYDNFNVLNTVYRTTWSDTSPFGESLHMLFADQTPGIQGLTDIRYDNGALNQTVGSRISPLIASGYERIALIQSGADDGATFTPTSQLTATHKSTNGSVGTLPLNCDSIVISGGALNRLGGIITSEITYDGTYSWVLCGGNGGLAILIRADGSGCPVGTLGKNFTNLPSDAQFKVIGTFKDVRKIVSSGSHVYVLTTSELRRIDQSQATFAAASSDQELGTVLASSNGLVSLFGRAPLFSDIIISGPLALIATDNGLIRVGNLQSIETSNESTMNWTLVPLPESVSAVTRLFPISPTGNPTEWATTSQGGNVYVLSAYTGKNQARVYRLSIASLEVTKKPQTAPDITDTTVQLFDDLYVKGFEPSFYLNCGSYRNYMATDGTVLYLTRSSYYPYKDHGAAFIDAPGSDTRTGIAFTMQNRVVIASKLPQPPATSCDLGPFVKRSAQGSFMTGGSAVFTNE